MPKPLKYSDSTPVDEPIPKGKIKAIEPGSGIKVAPEDNFSEYERRLKDVESKREKPSKGELLLETGFSMMKNMGKPEGKAKGGMTASSRADGCCTKGKTRGKMY
jgi:hypothetical protein